jgi:hypothetical protein
MYEWHHFLGLLRDHGPETVKYLSALWRGYKFLKDMSARSKHDPPASAIAAIAPKPPSIRKPHRHRKGKQKACTGKVTSPSRSSRRRES